MKNVGTWISADTQARIETPPIPLIKLEVDDESTNQIIKVNMRRQQSSVACKTYNINMKIFDNGQPEEFLSILNNFKIATEGTVTTTPSGQINYL